MSETDDPVSHGSVQIGAVRALIGLTQGVALYALFEAFQRAAWPATNGPLFAPLCAMAIFVPLIIVLDLTQLRPRLLAGWVVIVTLICVGLAWYDIYRDPIVYQSSYQNLASPQPRNLPSPYLWFGLALGLFIGHGLLISGATDARLVARYSTYFGVSWKYGLQAAMAAAFAGVFWLVLWLGAELFRLIKIDAVSQLIQKPWFWIPATTLALTCAVHVTDIRVGIIRGVRTLSCTLLAWLLPLMAIIAICFVAALSFTGLEPLWNTRRASSILLVAAASLIFLVNAAYQDGVRDGDIGDARPLPRLLRWSVAAACAVIVPIVLLAAYGISLRVHQYGWTSERVIATACALLAGLYAVGYAIAGIRSNVSLSSLEATNIVAAFAILVMVLALLTPLADPARIAVADQVSRLKAGAIAAEKFDYLFLRFGAGRFGVDALGELAGQKNLPIAAEKSADALQRKVRYGPALTPKPITPAERAGNITVVQPKGQTLPSAFLEADWTSQRPFVLPQCLTAHVKCDAVLVDLNGDGLAEIILLPSAGFGMATVFGGGNDRPWSYLGQLVGANCTGMADALRLGNFKLVQPLWQELDAFGRRLRLLPLSDCSIATNR